MPYAAAGTAKAADARALAAALRAAYGHAVATLTEWAKSHREIGNRSQFWGTWRSSDPNLVGELYEPGR